MWVYEKKLQFPVKIKKPDPRAASIIISQLGGPGGNLFVEFQQKNPIITPAPAEQREAKI